ncbi:ATP-binding protein [Shinella sp. H4-D48]|uniref:ATP-binding protein n=1 Tax=Shinella sp. H4-D48 TaxID=2925841 RepID=UPI001F52BEDE|nr:ATP-binding protein [Shinella sp. H4-D48]UNK39132.1 ATP-binding protein [Shinella sp. H4-D48]
MTEFHENPFKTPEERLAAAALGVPERQAMIERLLYKYPVFKKGEQFIRDFHFPFAGGSHGTGKIGGLLGSSRAGKSTICAYYVAGIDMPGCPGEDGERYPVLHITATDQTTPSSLADTIASATGMRSLPAKIKTQARMNMVLDRLRQVRTELVILDDAQFLFLGRTRSYLSGFQSFLKQLADLRTLNVLLIGEESVHDVIAGVDYLEGRGGFKREVLKPLGDAGKEFDDFRLLLSKIDARLPFKEPSVLHGSSAVAADVHAFTGGSIGRVMNLVRDAAALAMNDGASCIMLDHLRRSSTTLVRLGDTRNYFRKA